MSDIAQKLADLRINITPQFNVGKLRNGAQWFFGREFVVDGHTFQLAWFGDFSSGRREEWRSENPPTLTAEMQLTINQQIEEALADERRAREEYWEEVAKEAESLWAQGSGIFDHPYIVKKKLHNLHGGRVAILKEHPVLLIPMRDVDGKLWNLTRIYTTDFKDDAGNSRGNKFILKGGRKEGLFHTLGKVYPQGTLYLCEGFSTGASIAEALTNQTVIVCFDAGNLVAVASALKIKYPEAKFIVCSDDDRWKPEKGNAGLKAAQQACKVVKGEIRIPHFKDVTTEPTDFNDLHCLEGLTVVAYQIYNPPKDLAAPIPKEEKKSKAGEENRTVLTLLQKLEGNILKYGKDLFEYSPLTGIWHHLEPELALDKYYNVLNLMTNGKLDHRKILSAYSRFLHMMPTAPRNPFIPDRYTVGFSNGTLHLEPRAEGKWEALLKPHAREDLLIQSHPFTYDLQAPLNDAFESAVKRVLGADEEAHKAYYQVLGATLMPGAFRKLVFFIGPPKSGKSTLIMFAWHLVDPRFRCSVDPTEMFGFNMETMAGKLLNADPDITLHRPLTDSILKKIEDGMEVRVKRKKIADIYASIPGMHLFGGNGMPMTKDGAAPYDRRMLIFNCDKYQAPEGHNKQFVADTMRGNGQGILRRALEGLHMLCASGGHFISPQGAREKMADWKGDNETAVQTFMRELKDSATRGVELVDKESIAMVHDKDHLPTTKVYDVFVAWFEKFHPRAVPPSRNIVYKQLRDSGIKKKVIQGVDYYEGFKILEAARSIH